MEKITQLVFGLFFCIGMGVLSLVLASLNKKYLENDKADHLLNMMFNLSIFGILFFLILCIGNIGATT